MLAVLCGVKMLGLMQVIGGIIDTGPALLGPPLEYYFIHTLCA